ncbi:MAG TPA: ribonuclease P protein component [Flavisolibacter sp.]|nr:ribonuclease P protein component [Flavisolibacter sp.]
MPKPFGLGKKEKLKSRKQIDTLFATGKSFTVFPIRVTYRFLSTEEAPLAQIGVTVSKRYFKKAVDRNKVKRLLREAYRLQKTGLASQLQQSKLKAYVFFIYTDKTIGSFDSIKSAMSACLSKLQNKLATVHEDTL